MKARMAQLVRWGHEALPTQVLMAYGRSRAGSYALALAFAGFMSMFPMLLGALAIIGLAIRDPATHTHVESLVLQVFPASAQPELQQAIEGVRQSAGWLGLLALGGLVWSAGSLYATLEFALTQVFGTRPRGMLRQRLMGLVTMLLLAAAVVAMVAINSAAALFPLPSWASWTISLVAGALAMVALLCALYRFVPNRAFRLRDVLPGAILAGVLIELFSLVFPIYARFAGGFNTYGAEFALFFLLATWFYLLSQLLLLGAVFNRVRLEPNSSRTRPKVVAAAPGVTESDGPGRTVVD